MSKGGCKRGPERLKKEKRKKRGALEETQSSIMDRTDSWNLDYQGGLGFSSAKVE